MSTEGQLQTITFSDEIDESVELPPTTTSIRNSQQSNSDHEKRKQFTNLYLNRYQNSGEHLKTIYSSLIIGTLISFIFI